MPNYLLKLLVEIAVGRYVDFPKSINSGRFDTAQISISTLAHNVAAMKAWGFRWHVFVRQLRHLIYFLFFNGTPFFSPASEAGWCLQSDPTASFFPFFF